MRRVLKVGVLMDSLNSNSSFQKLIESLSRNNNIELILLHNNLEKIGLIQRIRKKINDEGLSRFISIVFFNLIISFEKKITETISKKFLKDMKNVMIPEEIFIKKYIINPIFYKKYFVKYSKADIKIVKNLNLDFILRGNGSGIFKGEILKSSKFGLLSLHHGDNQWNRGGPPGFWEVYLSKRKSGFIIQICNEKLDDGDVIFRGETATKSTYLRNRINLSKISYPFLEDIFNYVILNQKLPSIYPKNNIKAKLYKVPSFGKTLYYLYKISKFFIKKFFQRIILRKKQVWHIAYQENNWKNLNFSNFHTIENPKGRFFADPFMFENKNKKVIFVEDYSFKEKIGTISAISLNKNKFKIFENIINEDFHLSFPFVFSFKNKIYMIPESKQNRTIKLYECTSFPNDWKFSHNIMENVNAVDSIVFYKKPYWWLLTNLCDDDSQDSSSMLHAFYSDSPLSNNWKPHNKNPIVFSSDKSRNGGIIYEDNSILRVRQSYGFNKYGEKISISKIVKLDPDNFEEKEVKIINPSSLGRKIKFTHHLNGNKKFTVIDFAKH
tara:strand:- start:3438 stop:5096 length:1659 start_codon:yes stop_codon:yes gene_type:complete